MDKGTLEKGADLDRWISNFEALLEHLERVKDDDPIKEVENLLRGYNNLMGGFDRKQIAKTMIAAIKTEYGIKLSEAREQFEKL